MKEGTIAQGASAFTSNLLLVVGWALVALAVYMQFPAALGGDKNWLLMAARAWLDGKRLYVDVVETNPPLILWFYALPSLFAQMTGMQDYILLTSVAVLLALLSVLLCRKMLLLHPLFAASRALLELHTLLIAAVLLFWPSSVYFADREHLFVVCTLPYLFSRLPGLGEAKLPPLLMRAATVMAAFGFCIKPHTLIMFAFVQLHVLMRRRRLSALASLDNIFIVAAGCAYLAAVFWLAPEFVHTVLPMEALTYGAYRNTLITVFLYMPPLFTLLVAGAEFRFRHKTPCHTDVIYMLWLCAAGLCYALANNGWLYSFYPLNSFVLLAIGWLWMEYRAREAEERQKDRPFWRFRGAGYICALLYGFNTAFVVVPFMTAQLATPLATTYDKVLAEFQRIMRDNRFSSFGALPAFSPPWPMLARSTGARFETRFHVLWMLPRFVKANQEFRDRNEWVPRYVAEAYARDLSERKPEVMFVDTSPEFSSTKQAFDILRYLSGYSGFQAAWSAYTLLGKVDFCDEVDPAWQQKLKIACRYEVYRRGP